MQLFESPVCGCAAGAAKFAYEGDRAYNGAQCWRLFVVLDDAHALRAGRLSHALTRTGRLIRTALILHPLGAGAEVIESPLVDLNHLALLA